MLLYRTPVLTVSVKEDSKISNGDVDDGEEDRKDVIVDEDS